MLENSFKRCSCELKMGNFKICNNSAMAKNKNMVNAKVSYYFTRLIHHNKRFSLQVTTNDNYIDIFIFNNSFSNDQVEDFLHKAINLEY